MAAKYTEVAGVCGLCNLETINDEGTWQTSKLTVHKGTGLMSCGDPMQPIVVAKPVKKKRARNKKAVES